MRVIKEGDRVIAKHTIANACGEFIAGGVKYKVIKLNSVLVWFNTRRHAFPKSNFDLDPELIETEETIKNLEIIRGSVPPVELREEEGKPRKYYAIVFDWDGNKVRSHIILDDKGIYPRIFNDKGKLKVLIAQEYKGMYSLILPDFKIKKRG